MLSESSPLLMTILALAASLLALSVLVQILQEMFKHLWKSQARLYKRLLADWIGSVAVRLVRSPEFADLRVRGPFHLTKRSTAGQLLPLSRPQLVDALKRTAPLWVQRTLGQLESESKLQGDTRGALSGNFSVFLQKLGKMERGSSGYWTAHEIAGFLKEHGLTWEQAERTIGTITPGKSLDAAALTEAFRRRFLPHLEEVDRKFPQFESNLEYSNRRRNVKYTLVISLLVAICLNAPIQNLYERATRFSPDEAVALATEVIDIQERSAALLTDSLSEVTDSTSQQLDSLLQTVLKRVNKATKAEADNQHPSVLSLLESSEDVGSFFSTLSQAVGDWNLSKWLVFLFGCLITAILLSFGAPFWNDIVKALLRFRQKQEVAIVNRVESSEVSGG